MSPQLQGNAAAMAPKRRCKAGRCASPHGARTQLTGMTKLGGSAIGLSAGATDLAADVAGLDGGATEFGSGATELGSGATELGSGSTELGGHVTELVVSTRTTAVHHLAS